MNETRNQADNNIHHYPHAHESSLSHSQKDGNQNRDEHAKQHHHHHRHHSERYESHLRHKRQRELKKKIGNGLTIAFVVCAVVILSAALFAPQLLMSLSSSQTDLAPGVTIQPSGNIHTRLDYNGIDVSHHQGVIDWEKVGYDTCVQFVYIKATEGSTLIDEMYLLNVKGAKKAKIPVGSYHYLTSKSSIDNQFRNFSSVADRSFQELAPVIDIEEEGLSGWSRQDIQDSLAKMIHLIEQHYHCSPILYSYSKFYNRYLAPRFNSYRLFLAHYNINLPIVAGAGTHNIWQHSDQGVVDGIETPVDLNVFTQGTTLKDILISNPQ